MEIQDLQSLLEKPDDLHKELQSAKQKIVTPSGTIVSPDDIAKQYDPKGHEITDKSKR